ncbi:MAG: transposase [bacterium]|nr:transposase [bacterium]
MDMNAAYGKEVWRHCPRAETVYDLSNLVASLAGRSLIGCALTRRVD